jgi:hypothetical protein
VLTSCRAAPCSYRGAATAPAMTSVSEALRTSRRIGIHHAEDRSGALG